MVSAIVQLGQTLHLDLVAEGIETTEELAVLEKLGVEYGQGFHLGRPAVAGAQDLAAVSGSRPRNPGPRRAGPALAASGRAT